MAALGPESAVSSGLSSAPRALVKPPLACMTIGVRRLAVSVQGLDSTQRQGLQCKPAIRDWSAAFALVLAVRSYSAARRLISHESNTFAPAISSQGICLTRSSWTGLT